MLWRRGLAPGDWTMTTDDELLNGTGDHDCRHRVAEGEAGLVEWGRFEPHHYQLQFHCDVCGRTVYLQLEPFNIQIEQFDEERWGTVIEPAAGTERADIYDTDDLGPA